MLFQFDIGQNTYLRLLEARHAEALFHLVDQNREHLRKYMPWERTTLEVKDTRGFINYSLAEFARGGSLQLGIWVDGEIAGTIGINRFDHLENSGEIGYWLSKEHCGRGIITRAVQALLDECFYERGLHRVSIGCAKCNKPSRAVAERLGFRLEGTIKEGTPVGGEYEDRLIFRMLASEWKNRGTIEG
ncbi:GNAT family N-acetyltransferase [Mechercharimyces sp. CAU 1602]|uniref:GNAT family N-acetyltransferase n=1 Tax=Mechercharimyces sp. CAU 1602 TaxID=2973933 RepID=UPI0021611C1A|nr:GNAT family protein [Mechercharimyces sp. CAU 1602]MCS1351810.1 GNAT family N-acetyltransferase [Mechercharimyces sp. CAU 1602]